MFLGMVPGLAFGVIPQMFLKENSWVVPQIFLGMGPGLAFGVILQIFLNKSSRVVPQIFLEMGPGMLLMMLLLGWCPREDSEGPWGCPHGDPLVVP